MYEINLLHKFGETEMVVNGNNQHMRILFITLNVSNDKKKTVYQILNALIISLINALYKAF